jgi:alpha-beta hydrolase superfamily lysophospholipase
MFNAFRSWVRRHRILTGCLALLAALVILNALAFRQAYSMTHFVAEGTPIDSAASLSFADKLKTAFTGLSIPRPKNESTPAESGLIYEVHRFASTDGTELEAWFIPKDHPKGLVLLVHGYVASKSALLSEAKAFHDLGFATMLVDFRGSGGSSGNTTTIGVEEAEDVLAAWHYARDHWSDLPILLYGPSMGGAAILRAVAVHGISPTALMVECPFDRMLSAVENRFAIMGFPAFPAARLLVLWGGIQHGFNGFHHNPAEYARAVHCPTLVLHGTLDAHAKTEQVQRVFDNLAGPKEFVLFPDLGHQSYVSARPEEWKKAVSAFLLKHLPI